jgi:hypothetical protein
MINKDPSIHLGRNRIDRVPRRRWAALTVAVVTGLGAAVLAGVGPAAAAVPGLEAVDNTLAATSNRSQSVTVSCPAGKKLINASGYITGGAGSVAMDDIFPDPATDSVTVTGKEVDNYAAAWRPTAVATCAPALPGLVWVQATSASTSSDKSVNAACPAGKQLLGSGATILNGFGEVILDSIVPQTAAGGGGGAAAISVTVSAEEEAGYTPSWTLTAFASCANALPGQTVVRVSTPFDNSDPKALNAVCPAGQVATGGGAGLVTDPAGQGNLVIDDMFPNNVGAGIAPTQTTGYAYVEDAFAGSWELLMYSLCADA